MCVLQNSRPTPFKSAKLRSHSLIEHKHGKICKRENWYIQDTYTQPHFLLHGWTRDTFFRSGRGMGQNLQGRARWAKCQFQGIFKQISMFCWCYYCLCKQIKLKFDSFLCFFGEKSFFFGGKLLAFQYVIGTFPRRPARFSFLENSREFFFHFHFSFSFSRRFNFTFTSRKRVKGFYFSLFSSKTN